MDVWRTSSINIVGKQTYVEFLYITVGTQKACTPYEKQKERSSHSETESIPESPLDTCRKPPSNSIVNMHDGRPACINYKLASFQFGDLY